MKPNCRVPAKVKIVQVQKGELQMESQDYLNLLLRVIRSQLWMEELLYPDKKMRQEMGAYDELRNRYLK